VDCLAIRSFANDYLEDKLSVEDRKAFDKHISSCGKCQEWFEALQELTGALGGLSTEDLSALTKKVLLQQFKRRTQSSSPSDPESE